MSTHKRVYIIALLVAIFMAGCAPTSTVDPLVPSADGAPIVGFAQLGEESAWRLANTKSVMDAAQEANLQIMYRNAQQDQASQLKALRSFIAYKVDAIVFAPIVESGWEAVLQEAKDNGIPVILEDRQVEKGLEDYVTAWIGSDFTGEGVRAASFLLEKMKNVKGPINIVELTGTADSTAATCRHQGFFDTLKHDDRFQLLCSEAGDFMISKGGEVMRNVFKQYPPSSIDVVYSHNDDMTLGALEAIEAQGLAPGKDVVIITVDAQQKVVDLVKEGRVNCAIECNPNIGPQVCELVKQVIAGEDVPKRTYSTEAMFTEFDDLSDLPPRGY